MVVERLVRHFGSRLSRYGRGFKPIPDKAEAILPYRYHITLENSSVKDYWTEKLADAYLGGAYPLYWGCPNLADYFPSDAFTMIDIDDPDTAIATIEKAIDNDYFPKAVKPSPARLARDGRIQPVCSRSRPLWQYGFRSSGIRDHSPRVIL